MLRISIILCLLLMLVTGRSYSASIIDILEEYREKSELSKKTRLESEGHLIVLTREDLERMQAYTLEDVLKIVRFFILQKNMLGENVIAYATMYPINNTTIRLYINDHEVSSVYRRTPFPIWGEIPLDFVDHIEIYQGESAIRFNNETAGLIIKLYTKPPERENGGYLGTFLTSRKGYGLNTYYGKELDDYTSFFIFTGKNYIRWKKYRNDSKDIRQEIGNFFTYTYFRYKDILFEYSGMYKEADLFRGLAYRGAPDKDDFEGKHNYISITSKHLEDKSLKLILFYDDIKSMSYQETLTPSNFIIVANPTEYVKGYTANLYEKRYGVELYKTFNKSSNELFLGLKYQRSWYKIDDIRIGGSSLFTQNSENLYSLFIENSYYFSPENMLIAGFKYDRYERKKQFRDINGLTARVGIILFSNQFISFKSFASVYYTPPVFVEISTQPTLRKQRNKIWTSEITFKGRKHKFGILGGYAITKNQIVLNPVTLSYYNEDTILRYKFISFDYHLKLGKESKLDLNYFLADTNFDDVELGPDQGGHIKLFYSRNRFDLYTGFVYRKGYKVSSYKIKDGYDLTTAITYHIDDSKEISLKGDNLLNKALKTPTLIDSFKYSTIDRRFTIIFKWFF
ncbi:TonB-dependent receptor plug domain-containing protein [Persephonella sp.]